uniref:Thioester reductase (TE) domain-containing protein n=1 Tax=Moniliophthora roreri TaxID=221103 RepID=A0A0W0EWU3_MONRR
MAEKYSHNFRINFLRNTQKKDSRKLVEADLLKENFGLSREEYDAIQFAVTHIIHNAWRVRLNDTLDRYEENVAQLRVLIDFALTTDSKFVFIGSSGIFQRITEPKLLEKPVSISDAIGQGYGESKWVAEAIILKAIEEAGFKALIIRVGLLCGGSERRAWSIHGWVPSLMQSARHLNCIPTDEGLVDWLTTDHTAEAALRFLDYTTINRAPIFHLRHPHPVPWADIMRIIASHLNVAAVPYKEWLARLVDASQGESAETIPATRLLRYYQSIVRTNPVGREAFALYHLDITEAQKAGLGQDDGIRKLNEDIVKRWLRHWGVSLDGPKARL